MNFQKGSVKVDWGLIGKYIYSLIMAGILALMWGYTIYTDTDGATRAGLLAAIVGLITFVTGITVGIKKAK